MVGADTFIQESSGNNIHDAFSNGIEAAAYDHGHAGYTGTLAEKTEFTEIDLPEGQDPYDFADKLIGDCDSRVDDKWGPAGVVKIPDRDNTWLFFGWASS